MFLTIAEQVYKLITQQIAKKYDRKNRVSIRYSVPVISVGNISVGGTGKTPLVALLAKILHNEVKQIAIVSRGYGRASKGLIVVSNGNKIVNADTRLTGDEPQLLAQLLPYSMVICHEKRALGCQKAIEMGADCIILDDGFQHRAVHRDCDIVLIDKKTLNDSHLLPKGRLREPHSALQRADILVGTGGVSVQDLQSLPIKSNGIYCSVQANPQDIRYIVGSEQQRLIAVSGIANPERFMAMLRASSLQILHHFALKDHVSYTSKIVKNIINLAKQHNAGIITTEKDLVKLQNFVPEFRSHHISLAVLPLTVTIAEGQADLHTKILSILSSFETKL